MAAVLQADLNVDQRCHCKSLGAAAGQAPQLEHDVHRLDGAGVAMSLSAPARQSNDFGA